MIENKVSILLGARRESIMDLSRGAGLHYGTAHALYHGTTNRIEFDVLDRLCRYFGVGVGEIFVYRPDSKEG